MAPVLKTGEGASPPEVRILSLPLSLQNLKKVY
jgi:hypothetical protein